MAMTLSQNMGCPSQQRGQNESVGEAGKWGSLGTKPCPLAQNTSPESIPIFQLLRKIHARLYLSIPNDLLVFFKVP